MPDENRAGLVIFLLGMVHFVNSFEVIITKITLEINRILYNCKKISLEISFT